MSTIKVAYAARAAITLSMASKTSGQGRRSAIVDNSANLYVDVLVNISLKTGTVSAGSYFAVYAYSGDGTTTETGGTTDADWNTLRGDEKLLGIVACPSSTTVYAGEFSVAKAYGGAMPSRWGIIVVQTNCGTLSATEGDHVKSYEGVTYTVA